MARKPEKQSSLGGILLTLVALVLALGVVVWLVADTPFDGGSQVATDPPKYEQMSEPNSAQVNVSPAPKTSGPATGQ